MLKRMHNNSRNSFCKMSADDDYEPFEPRQCFGPWGKVYDSWDQERGRHMIAICNCHLMIIDIQHFFWFAKFRPNVPWNQVDWKPRLPKTTFSLQQETQLHKWGSTQLPLILLRTQAAVTNSGQMQQEVQANCYPISNRSRDFQLLRQIQDLLGSIRFKNLYL